MIEKYTIRQLNWAFMHLTKPITTETVNKYDTNCIVLCSTLSRTFRCTIFYVRLWFMRRVCLKQQCVWWCFINGLWLYLLMETWIIELEDMLKELQRQSMLDMTSFPLSMSLKDATWARRNCGWLLDWNKDKQ